MVPRSVQLHEDEEGFQTVYRRGGNSRINHRPASSSSIQVTTTSNAFSALDDAEELNSELIADHCIHRQRISEPNQDPLISGKAVEQSHGGESDLNELNDKLMADTELAATVLDTGEENTSYGHCISDDENDD